MDWTLILLGFIASYLCLSIYWRWKDRKAVMELIRRYQVRHGELRNQLGAARAELLAANAARAMEAGGHADQMKNIGDLVTKLSAQRIKDCKTMRHLEADRERLLRQIREGHPQ